ncbi:hypothetical protein [Kribbella sp. VKM Ac-2568]|uniref:hypothetical protein n=1 Tax=Kribbella sp. VKM Ac-2568 TaxID=2512219 RepID=UPI0010509982|nr:hypothetical protein [Kribbella sp. VKM Ac-2568]TCM35990.1 hypothetical protein EV648_12338 [Kribbella sp. VKM Ac-2568]
MSGTIEFPALDPKVDVVTAVLVPADRASRRAVTSGVTATLLDPTAERALPDRMVRSLSGALVLLNRPLGQAYTFRIDPTAAGYAGPFTLAFQPQAAARRRVVWLSSRPDSPIDAGATVVRGVITRSAADASASGLEVAAVPDRSDGGAPADGDPTFVGITDRSGSFAVALSLEPPDDGDLTAEVDTTITLNRGGTPQRDLVVPLRPGREHVFSEPLDLDGNNEPPFTEGA